VFQIDDVPGTLVLQPLKTNSGSVLHAVCLLCAHQACEPQLKSKKRDVCWVHAHKQWQQGVESKQTTDQWSINASIGGGAAMYTGRKEESYIGVCRQVDTGAGPPTLHKHSR
jgi:hypothetical protein